ncbi:HAMP domain-containing histidine kinase [Halobacillus yeomjeoni]|uniref:HAMP domain-containing sensor histidine kinase n=1 Tax=Halobacillus yeomjeoni TaxID=311194 RepID=UPI001CD5384A|nr:HAMP domain-containing sensor histidine kinase [Halobacillus yeomjeoni]MCA0984325.1 HAMP domain-containing histidine kinase [Halobacillus yeomjeoni]
MKSLSAKNPLNRILNPRRQSLLFQFTSLYILNLLVIIFFISVVVMAGMCYFLIQNTDQELQAMEKKLATLTEEEYPGEVQESLDEVLYPDHANYYVEIRASEESTIARSRGYDEMTEEEDEEEDDEFHLNLPGSYVWNDDQGLYIQKMIPWQSTSESGIIEVNVQLNQVAEFLTAMAQIILTAALLCLIIGSIFIYKLTKRNLRPLFVITDAVGEMESSPDLTKRVPVPETPRELNELGTRFNDLLFQLEKQFEREKSFVSNASHELRTPLTAFKGHLNLIKRWGKKDPEILDQAIEALKEESDRMEKMMVQLLTIARNEQMETQMEKVDLTKVINQTIQQFQSSTTIQIKGDLEEDLSVKGDEEQLRQIFVILLDNAIHYSDDKGEINVTLQKQGGSVELSVSDQGIGIPFEEQKKIFDRFYRVDKNRSRKTGGTGLGLSIAKELVDNHSGSLRVESVPGEGSTFIVRIPCLK